MRNIYFEGRRRQLANLPLFAHTYTFTSEDAKRFPDPSHPEISPDTMVCYRNHFHSSIEIQHVIEGAMHVEAGEDSFEAQAGDILMFNRYEPHFGCVDKSLPYVKYTYLKFDLEQMLHPGITGGIPADLANGKSTFVRRIRSEETGRLMDEIAAQCKDSGTDSSAELEITMLFFGVLHEIDRAGGIRRNQPNVPGLPEFTLRMSEYIAKHYTEEITMEMLCEKFSYHPSYFCRLFKKHFGKPFFNYLEEYRITQAVDHFLKNPDSRIPIGELAARVGFPNYSRFSHSFKKIVGMSPTEYKNSRSM
ncbi:MAG: helix-turn-helix domain-containing protein [Ruminococcaceae bacterium]|nr:helix-turn-helix domain-containing protein [Oscillospiraceae bacterium]